MRIHTFTLKTLAALALGSALVGAHAQVPEGKVGINYSRCDKTFDGWGLHTWKNPGIPLPGVEWQKPMPPTGTNDFGVYWHMDLAEYGGSQTVNYIVHKGDTKEQGGKDMKFSAKDNKEIWINSGDRKIYFSLDDAKKGREEKPCQ
jgi:Bacterial pullanase-associated domain